MGALDMLIVPVTGPSEASSILKSTLPMAEQTLERWRYRPERHSGPLSQPSAPTALSASSEPAAGTTPITKAEPGQTTAEDTEIAPEIHRHGEASTITGGVIGGVLGAAVALLIPGIGPVISGGLLASILGGAALGGLAGNFFGAFTQLGIPSEHARAYEHKIREGHIIITINTPDPARQQEASAILRQHGSYDVQIHNSTAA